MKKNASQTTDRKGSADAHGSLPAESCPYCAALISKVPHRYECDTHFTGYRGRPCYERGLATMREALLACDDHLPRLVHILRRSECYASADATGPIIGKVRAALKAENIQPEPATATTSTDTTIC